EQALEEALEKPNLGEETLTYLGLGNISFELDQYTQGINYYLKALELANKTGVLENKRDGYLGLAKSYKALSDFEKAFTAQENYTATLDSLKTEDYARDMSNLRVQFDLENAERENELLKAQNTLNEVQIEQARRNEQLYLIIMGLFLAIIAGFVFQYFYIRRTNRRLAFERNRSDQILLNILPKETADELKENGFVRTRELEQVTVLFTDFRAFSTIAERISAEDLIRSVDYYFKNFDEITERYNLEKIKTIGDSYMCAGGLPNPNKTHAHDAFGAALEIRRFVLDTELNPPKGIYPFKIRIGLNSGPVVSGVVGTRKFAYDIWGSTVNIAARMESGSIPGRINVSENTYKLLKEDYEFTYRGEIEVKNGQMLKMYFAEVSDSVMA
ncbi:MAG: adenylate/guanylate cyclase domain-containing protein, partial [Eudoraea sp.]|nr:adenylate/guanylate cyclase domain-containing protein [Eudoraea sp.]